MILVVSMILILKTFEINDFLSISDCRYNTKYKIYRVVQLNWDLL